MTVKRVFPVGTDTVEILTDGEGMTAHCIACHPPVLLNRWDEHVTLNLILVALFDHQDHITAPTSRTT